MATKSVYQILCTCPDKVTKSQTQMQPALQDLTTGCKQPSSDNKATLSRMGDESSDEMKLSPIIYARALMHLIL